MSRRTQDPTGLSSVFVYRACTFFGGAFNLLLLTSFINRIVVLLPQRFRWFGLLPFRSPLLRESLLFSFPPGTQMFHFPGLLSHSLSFQLWITLHYQCWVSPFGYRRIFVYLPLPVAFRRLLRPSSAP